MTTTTQTHVYEMRRVAALQIAVAALEQANAAEGRDPLSAGAFRAIVAMARGIVAHMDLRLGDLESGGDNERNRDG